MKNVLIKSMTVAGLMFGATMTFAAQAAIDPGLERSLINVCKALKSDNKISLKRAVKRSRVSYKSLGEGLVCNGKPALQFASFHGSNSTAELFAQKAQLNERDMLAKR